MTRRDLTGFQAHEEHARERDRLAGLEPSDARIDNVIRLAERDRQDEKADLYTDYPPAAA